MPFWPGFSLPIAFGTSFHPPSSPPTSPPGTPTGAGLVAGPEQLTFSFTGNAEAANYTVEYADNAGFTSSTSQVIGGTSLVVTSLDHNTTYYFRVLATNAAGSSANTAAVSDSPNQLAAPQNGVASNVTDTETSVAWDAVTNAVTYTVIVGTSAGGSQISTHTGLTNPAFTKTGLTAGLTYHYGCYAVGVNDGVLSADVEQATTGGQTADITISVTLNGAASSTASGVGPFGVMFDAQATTSTHTTNHFRELDFYWDFGDVGSGDWAYGNQAHANVKSRNIGYGPQAAHVYEGAGTYVATLYVRAVTAANAVLLKMETYSITAQNPTVIYAGTDTIVISRAGNFAGKPDGAQEIQTQAWSDAKGHMETANKRVLLRTGESWTNNSAVSIATGVTVGSFGGGAKPIITSTTSGAYGWQVASPTIRMMDLDLRGSSTAPTYPVSGPGFTVDISDGMAYCVMLRVDIKWSRYCISSASSGQDGGVRNTDLFIHDGSMIESREYGFFGCAERLSVQGCLMGDMQTEHIFRTETIDVGVIAHNHSYDAVNDKDFWALRNTFTGLEGNAWNTPNEARYYVFSDNTVACTPSGSSTPAWVVQIGPPNNNPGTDGRTKNAIWERNFIYGSPVNQDAETGFLISAFDSACRNNIVDITNFQDDYGIRLNDRGEEAAPDNVLVSFNTVYKGNNDQGTPIGVRIQDGTNNIVHGALVYFPSGGGTSVQDQGTTSTVDHNTGDVGTVTTPPGFSGTPGTSDATAYQTTGSGYGDGYALELKDSFGWRDFTGALRSTTAPSLGAWEP